MKIEECTQTKDGSPIRIYATDGEANIPIHGAFWNGREWRLMGWSKEGKAFCLNSNKDLAFHNWRDDIPWEHLQNWIQWVAMDNDNVWKGFLDEPYIVSGLCSMCWDVRTDKAIKILGVKMPTPPDWRNSKAKRPEGR